MERSFQTTEIQLQGLEDGGREVLLLFTFLFPPEALSSAFQG
jgi:hypothetical protein